MKKCENYHFFSNDSFEVKSLNGVAWVVKNPHDCDDFSHLIGDGKGVRINGKPVSVKYVERFAHCPPWRKGEPISLLIVNPKMPPYITLNQVKMLAKR